jgi:hypothetical protein
MKIKNYLQRICFHIIYQDAKLKIIHCHLFHIWIKTSKLNGNIAIIEFLNFDKLIALIPSSYYFLRVL